MHAGWRFVGEKPVFWLTVRVGDGLPPEQLARFVDGSRGGEPCPPAMLPGVVLSGSATGVVSSRNMERATSESVAFRFSAGQVHPDHSPLWNQGAC